MRSPNSRNIKFCQFLLDCKNDKLVVLVTHVGRSKTDKMPESDHYFCNLEIFSFSFSPITFSVRIQRFKIFINTCIWIWGGYAARWICRSVDMPSGGYANGGYADRWICQRWICRWHIKTIRKPINYDF